MDKKTFMNAIEIGKKSATSLKTNGDVPTRFFFQAYIFVFPSKAEVEVNLSMVWCLLAVGFAYKILSSLTGLYFEGDDGT